MSETPTIETIRFGGRGPQQPDNFDDWARHSVNHLLRPISSPFQAEASFWQLGPIVVTEQRLGAFEGARTPERLIAVPTNQVTFVVVLEGAMTYRGVQTDAIDVAHPGDVVLLDLHRAYQFGLSANHTMLISMDRGALEDEIGPLCLEGRMPRTAETGMLFDFAVALVPRLPGMDVMSALPMAGVLHRLLVTALRRGQRYADPGLTARRAAALAYVASQPAGRLDVTAMAAALGVTRASLYRQFRGDGGVLAFDRRRRLRLLHRSLVEEGASVPLNELGARFGFLDPSNLARQFRAQFGLSMSEVRRHLLPRVAASDDIGHYRAAIERFV